MNYCTCLRGASFYSISESGDKIQNISFYINYQGYSIVENYLRSRDRPDRKLFRTFFDRDHAAQRTNSAILQIQLRVYTVLLYKYNSATLLLHVSTNITFFVFATLYWRIVLIEIYPPKQSCTYKSMPG